MMSKSIMMISAIALALFIGGCSKKQIATTGTSNTGGTMSQAKPGSMQDFASNVGTVVHFSTDSVKLTDRAITTLKSQAAWLNRYSQYVATIEGHADERGTREYNLALGGRRAATVKAYLTQLGVSAARLKTITYGKERPVSVCNDISCWSKNRRAETRLSIRGAGL